MKKPLAALASAALALGALIGTGVAAPPPAQSAPYCGITWGSLEKWESRGDHFSQNTVKSVRSGRHACYDRLVIDVRGDILGHTVGYYPEPVYGNDEKPVPLRGSAYLMIEVSNPSVTKYGKFSWDPGNRRELVDVTGYRTFRQVALGAYGDMLDGPAQHGSFNYTHFGLGVRARLPFRTFVLDGPGSGQRLVIDVAHRW